MVNIVYRNIILNELKRKFHKAKDSKIYLNIKQVIYEFATNYNLKYLKMSTYVIFSSLFFVLLYIFFYNIFHSVIPTLLMSALISLIPYNVFTHMLKKRKQNILKIFPSFVLSLKNYTDVDNNIIYAFSMSEPNIVIRPYIEKFNISVESGIDVYTSFENLKEDIGIEEISQFIILLENCYLNGGSFSKVIAKYSNKQAKINIEKEKINENLLSSKIILIVLVGLSLILLFGFALNNSDYSEILLYTTGGRVVLSINIMTYFFMYLIYLKICKMEE